MPFTKVVKNKPYFKRFQTKYRRRRSGQTDFYARRKLVTQAKNKYAASKYRFVVRFTSRDIVCQIVYSKIQGDMIMASAYSHELPNYGVKVGLTNYAAAYCTGLLLARRVLKKLGLDETYEGQTDVNGEKYIVEALEESPRPFKAYLDVGLKRTSTGSKVFGAMKGAVDGGIYIPHNERRFPGYDVEGKTLDADLLKEYIFGSHVANYMRELEEDDEERYKIQFASYIENELTADDLEDMYTEAHEKIRENPEFKKKERSAEDIEQMKSESKKHKTVKLTYEQRQERIVEKKKAFLESLNAED